MPDKLGVLYPHEKAACADWVKSKVGSGGNLICQVCQTNKWEIADHLLTGHIFIEPPTALHIGVSVYPFFQMVCENCGNTLLFNAVDAHIVENPPPLKPTSKEVGA